MGELGTLFATEGEVDKYFQCGKRAKALVPRLGMYYACVLPQNHEGPCAHGGQCFKHGSYVGDKCPEWPNCEANAPTFDHRTNEAIWQQGLREDVQPMSYLAPVSEAEMLDLTNSFGLVRAEYPGKLIDTDRVKNRVLIHLRFAEEREAAALLQWASSYCDGLDRALRIAQHKD